MINAINGALLGPVFGVAGNATQYFGGSPQQVAAANEAGAEALTIAGATQLDGLGGGDMEIVSEPFTTSGVEAGIQWGQGIQNQGMPWENYLAGQLPAGTQQLPPNYMTFDFYNSATQTAISAKTLDTMGSSYLGNTTKVYSTLAGYVDSAANFTEYELSGVPLDNSIIQTRQLQVAVPANTTTQQWQQINQAIQYGRSKGVQVIVTPVQ